MDPAFCPACGGRVEAEIKYCGVCGENLARFRKFSTRPPDAASKAISDSDELRVPGRTVYGLPGPGVSPEARPDAFSKATSSKPPPGRTAHGVPHVSIAPPAGLITSGIADTQLPASASSSARPAAAVVASDSGRPASSTTMRNVKPEDVPRSQRAPAPPAEADDLTTVPFENRSPAPASIFSQMPRGVFSLGTGVVVLLVSLFLWHEDRPVAARAARGSSPRPAHIEPSKKKLEARSPTLTLAVPSRVITDRDRLIVRGRTEPDAQVWIDGMLTSVRDGSFTEAVSLPSNGKHRVEIVARRDYGPPASRTIEVERVHDLRVALKKYTYDQSVKYAQLASRPMAYRGSHVAFTGTVYNVAVTEGGAAMQLRVAKCKQSSGCPLWITYVPRDDVREGSKLRVGGEVMGFEKLSVRGQTLRVPHLIAEIVVPLGKK